MKQQKKQCPDSIDWRLCHHSTVFNYCAHIAWLIDYVLAKIKNRSVSTGAERKTRHPGNLVFIILMQTSSFFFWMKEVAVLILVFFSLVVFFYGERLPLHCVCFFLHCVTPLKKVDGEKRTGVLSEAYQHGFSPTLVYPLCYLSFPFQFQLDINPTREHKKWVKSPYLWSNPIQRGFWLEAKHWLTHV